MENVYVSRLDNKSKVAVSIFMKAVPAKGCVRIEMMMMMIIIIIMIMIWA
jgi:hypothetical protein